MKFDVDFVLLFQKKKKQKIKYIYFHKNIHAYKKLGQYSNPEIYDDKTYTLAAVVGRRNTV